MALFRCMVNNSGGGGGGGGEIKTLTATTSNGKIQFRKMDGTLGTRDAEFKTTITDNKIIYCETRDGSTYGNVTLVIDSFTKDNSGNITSVILSSSIFHIYFSNSVADYYANTEITPNNNLSNNIKSNEVTGNQYMTFDITFTATA